MRQQETQQGSPQRILVVGGGLAGLSCARALHGAGLEVRLFEASDAVGGRVRTDEVDGFLLDRGFQVLLEAYPECQRLLDYKALNLKSFYPGAIVRSRGKFHTMADPFRMPLEGLRGALTPIGNLADKMRVARLRQRVLSTDLDEILARPESTTHEALRAEGFSGGMIEHFFRPFLGGIFLESELETSSRMFEFVFKMFSSGPTSIPAGGMQEIPRQLAAGLPEGTIRTGVRVEEVAPGRIRLDSGESAEGDAVVLAAAPMPGQEWLADLPEPRQVDWCSTSCLYYSAPEAPVDRPALVLSGDANGPVNNLCVPSLVSSSYAPKGKTLISATTLTAASGGVSDRALDADVRTQLRGWFGAVVEDWELLRIYRIPRALPAQKTSWLEPAQRPVKVGERLYRCGDFLDTASIQGAMVSGRRAAEAVLADAVLADASP